MRMSPVGWMRLARGDAPIAGIELREERIGIVYRDIDPGQVHGIGEGQCRGIDFAAADHAEGFGVFLFRDPARVIDGGDRFHPVERRDGRH